MRPFWEADSGSDEAAALPDVPLALGTGEDAKQVMVKAPPVQNFFYAVFNGAAIMGCFSKEEGRVNPLIPVLMQAGGQFPGCFSMFWQVPLFGRAFGSGNSVELELRCDNEELLNRCAGMLFGQLLPVYGYPQPEPQSFNVGRPEVQAVVDRIKAADLGLSVADIGFTVAAAINGAYVGSYIDDGDEIDLVIKVEGLDRPPRIRWPNFRCARPAGRSSRSTLSRSSNRPSSRSPFVTASLPARSNSRSACRPTRRWKRASPTFRRTSLRPYGRAG
jgi:hypothetical protein